METTQVWGQPQATRIVLWLVFDLLIGVVVCWGLWPRIQAYQKSLQFIRWILPVYCVLLLGNFSLRNLGIDGIDWSLSIRRGSLLLLLFGGVGIVAGRYFLYPLNFSQDPANKNIPTFPTQNAISQNALLSQQIGNALFYILLSGGRELHAAFWRAGVALLLQNDWGIWVALFPLVGELILLKDVQFTPFLGFILLLTTTTLFVYTHNFWFCWGLHAVLALSWKK